MRRVSINGASYALPFADLLRPLTDDEFAGLAGDIDRHGAVLSPVIVYVSRLHGRAVVDGANRAAVAARFGLPVPLANLGERDDDEARGYVYSLNLERRHLTFEERNEARRKAVREMLAAGKGVKETAREYGIEPRQVRRDRDEGGHCPPSPLSRVTCDARRLGKLYDLATAAAVESEHTRAKWLRIGALSLELRNELNDVAAVLAAGG